MDQERLIRSLKLQLRLERAAIALVVLFFLIRWGYGQLQSRPYAIVANGRLVASVATEEQARTVIDRVKRSVSGGEPSEVTFAEQVTIERAHEGTKVLSPAEAVRVAQETLTPRLNKPTILINDVPVVAVDSKEDAGAVLEAAKQKFGTMVENLMEEPLFKEQVKVQQLSVDPELYKPDIQEALTALISGGGAGSDVYVVSAGDLASQIASRLRMKLSDLQDLNPEKDLDNLQIGDRLRVSTKGNSEKKRPRLTVVVRDRGTRTEPIPFRTETISSVKMYAGKELVLSPGKNGLRQVVVATTYENGIKTGSEVLQEVILRNPVPRRIAIGIKPRP